MITKLDVLELALLQAQSTTQLKALIIHYTHQEILQAYNRLALEQQIKIQKIWQGELESGIDTTARIGFSIR
ncbi:hypothetical protein ACL6C3_19605 [Capilliphycus salinus ALCB114379]|uniref:hypothetical protein n=1 Tax=Capilliphycus salinus TaxID=2768948 RepID=UPI0039A6140A